MKLRSAEAIVQRRFPLLSDHKVRFNMPFRLLFFSWLLVFGLIISADHALASGKTFAGKRIIFEEDVSAVDDASKRRMRYSLESKPRGLMLSVRSSGTGGAPRGRRTMPNGITGLKPNRSRILIR